VTARTLEARFISKVSFPESSEGCWEWIGSKNHKGYGQFQWKYRNYRAHRIAFELLVSPIEEGMVIDHLCRNRSCVNPWHMEPVTNKENIMRGEGHGSRNARKTHCPQGHPYSGWNLIVRIGHGSRECRTCRFNRSKTHRTARLPVGGEGDRDRILL